MNTKKIEVYVYGNGSPTCGCLFHGVVGVQVADDSSAKSHDANSASKKAKKLTRDLVQKLGGSGGHYSVIGGWNQNLNNGFV